MTHSDLYELVASAIGTYDVEYIIDYLDKYVSELSGNQIYSYFDKNGNPYRIELRSKLEQVMRGISGEAYSELMELEAELLGTDLILLSAHLDCSRMCRNDQGTVVSRTGNTPGFKTKANAIQDGFYHYGHYGNCRHVESPYIKGFTEIPKEWSKWTESEMDNAYKTEQIKRYNERMIRKYAKQGKDDLVKIWKAKPHDSYRIF